MDVSNYNPIDNSIMEKVTKIEENTQNYYRCLEARVCPKCGSSISCTEVWEDGGKDYFCSSCQSKFSY